MVWDLAIALLSAAAGFLGMLCLMLAWFGDSHARPITPGVDGLEDPSAPEPVHGEAPFIPMPNHLNSHDEMVAWFTTELPKLTAAAKPRV